MLNNTNPPPSANPGFTRLINPTGELEKITKFVVLYNEDDRFVVYRKSTKSPGSYSRETYAKQQNGSFKRIKKDKKKYRNLAIPDCAQKVDYKGIDIFSMISLEKRAMDGITKFIDSIN